MSCSFNTGHAEGLVGDDAVTTISNWTSKYGPIFKLQILNDIVIMVTDPETVQRLLRKPSDTYLPKSRELYMELEFGTKPHTASILTASDGPYYKALRQGIAPCFSITNLKHVSQDKCFVTWSLWTDKLCLGNP
jgi:cytochrome P450